MLVSFRTSLVSFATCIPLLLHHAADTSQSARPGSSACQNATLMSKSASTRECPPLVFLIDAALEMMILMPVPANVSNRTPWATSIATSLLRTNGQFSSLFHLIKPLTSDFLTSSHRDRNTFKQLMSDHCIVLSLPSNLHQVWRQPFTCLVVIGWSVVYLVCGNATHRNLVRGQKRTHRKTGHSTLSFAFWPLLLHCFVTFRDEWSDRKAMACARLLTAGSMSSDSITSMSTPPVCAAVDVEMRFGAAGSGGAGCPSWALASTGPSSPAHRRSNRARHRSVCC